MKDLFKWYFRPSPEEIGEIWKNGMLTVDTNVLLDLYRYHDNTRKALLDSLNQFKGRAWISHQVADEFFRNRKRVILSSNTSFNEAERSLSEIQRAIDEPLRKMKLNRIIPDKFTSELEDKMIKMLDDATDQMGKIKGEFPDYLNEDPIFDNVCNLFDSRVGRPFDSKALPEILKEAKRRVENRIPPGFKDSNKDGDKAYGDYILWRQILNQVQEEKRPLIFVTSEEKEDWWEKFSGKTVGPLYELLKEFYEETKQPFLLYKTARFLEYSSEKIGKETNPATVAEIRTVAAERSTTQPIVRSSYVVIGYRSRETRERFAHDIKEKGGLTIDSKDVRPVLLPALLKFAFKDLKIGEQIFFSKNFLATEFGHFGGFRKNDLGITIDYRIRKGLAVRKGERYTVQVDANDRTITFISR